MAWAQDQLFNPSISLNNMGGSIGYVADAAARTALETSFIENGVTNIPNGIFICQLDDGSLWRWYSVGSTWTKVAQGSPLLGTVTSTHIPYASAANTFSDTALTYDSATKCITFPLPPSPGAITGILESTGINMVGFFRGPNWIQLGQAGSTYATVIYGKSTTPTNDPTLLGGALVSTGYWDADVDGGLRSLVIPISYGLLTGSGTAYIARDHDADTRFFQVQCYADAGVAANNFVGVKIYGSNGASLFMDTGRIQNVGAATTAGDAPQLEQLAGRLMVRI